MPQPRKKPQSSSRRSSSSSGGSRASSGRSSSGSTSRSSSSRSTSRSSSSSGTGTGTASRARSSAASPKQSEGLRDQLQRLLDPREVMVVTRSRLQEALDDAVERGRMTRGDATELLTDLISRGRKQTDDLLSDLEGFVSAPASRVMREVDRARRATGIGPSFPILGYDDLTAAEVNERLRDLSPPELRKVRDYERRNANRKSVLAAIEQQLK
jgi:polyhydroxyalkanoate synthesis regulator phasin